MNLVHCPNNNDLSIACFDDAVDVDGDEMQPHKYLSFDVDGLAMEKELSFCFAGTPAYVSWFLSNADDPTNFKGHFGFLRQAVFAQPGSRKCSAAGEIGDKYGYLDGYALGGFSGAPVMVPRFGLPPDSALDFGHYLPRKLVGVMVRRVEALEDGSAGQHAGLSYFVRSDSIRRLIEQSSA